MRKSVNRLGQHILTADRGKTLTNGEIYTKIYISKNDIDESAWTEVDDSKVPVDDELTAEEALSIILGGDSA